VLSGGESAYQELAPAGIMIPLYLALEKLQRTQRTKFFLADIFDKVKVSILQLSQIIADYRKTIY
jgi:hypothetical protein